MLLAAGGAGAAEVPPFMVAGSAARIQQVGSRYVVTAEDGTTRTWYRLGPSWYDGRGARFDPRGDGWRERGRAGGWAPTATGWRGPDGQRLVEGPVRLRAGSATFIRVHDGLRRDH